MNKKADMSVALLVLLVLLTAMIAIFTFISSGGMEVEIYDAFVVEGIYVQENIAEFYVRQIGEDVLKVTREGFTETVEGRNSHFASKVKGAFRVEVEKYSDVDSIFEQIKGIVATPNFVVTSDGKSVNMNVSGFNGASSSGKINATFVTDIIVKINFAELNLENI